MTRNIYDNIEKINEEIEKLTKLRYNILEKCSIENICFDLSDKEEDPEKTYIPF